MKPKIFCWINEGEGTDWQVVMAVAEDGCFLASHVSSSETWARHDIGLTSDWKHDRYQEHYPDGYELEWVENAKTHEGLQAAYVLNQQQAPVEERSIA
jgi:hypothetical protein